MKKRFSLFVYSDHNKTSPTVCPIIGLLISRCERSARFHQDVRKAGSIFWPVPATSGSWTIWASASLYVREDLLQRMRSQLARVDYHVFPYEPPGETVNGLSASAEGRQRFNDSCVPIGGYGSVERVSLPAKPRRGLRGRQDSNLLTTVSPGVTQC